MVALMGCLVWGGSSMLKATQFIRRSLQESFLFHGP